MNRRSNLNLGDAIKDIVQDALNNGDFNRLNQEVKKIVKGALDEAGKSINFKRESNKSKSHNKIINNYNKVIRQTDGRSKFTLPTTKSSVAVGRVSGILLTVFGIIGSFAFGIAVFVLTLLGSLIGGKEILYPIAMVLFPLFIISIILFMNGNIISKRLKRFQRYIKQIGNRNYGMINEFSSATGLSKKAVLKDLRKMIDIGMFPEGRIDNEDACFILNNECYEQYLNLQKGIEMRNMEQERSKNINDRLKPEIRKAIDGGRKFVMEIKDANIAIPGEEISRKLDRLEEVTGKIYDYVEVHPEKLPEIKKFAEYFLPTTLKLVDAYKKLDSHSIQVENISNSKKEIEETMDTINFAFENLLNGLFEDMAIDISTDISVLQTMFAQEGLTENNIRIKNKLREDKDE